jgi:hypothetical protein
LVEKTSPSKGIDKSTKIHAYVKSLLDLKASISSYQVDLSFPASEISVHSAQALEAISIAISRVRFFILGISVM